MAKYRVVAHPGVPGPQGFVHPGGTLILPDTATPSRFLVPLDEAAHQALTKAKAEYVEGLEKRMGELDPPRKLNDKVRKDLLKVPELPKPADPDQEPADGEEAEDETPADEGLSIRELAEQRGAVEAPRGRGKRAADSQ
jgi:hypothetical protein